MDKNRVFALFLALVMIFTLFSALNSASAVMYKFDKGTSYYSYYGDNYKQTWNTYLNTKTNNRFINVNSYYPNKGKWELFDGEYVSLQKGSKNKIKITTNFYRGAKEINYKKTKLSIRDYYWKIYRPKYLKSY